MSGSWTEELFIDGDRFWKYDELRGYPVRGEEKPMPSDARLREDLVYLKEGDEEVA